MVMILSMSSALLTLKADKSFTYTPTSGLSFTYKGHAENHVKLRQLQLTADKSVDYTVFTKA